MDPRDAINVRLPAYAELLIDSMDRYTTGFPTAGNLTSSSDWRTNLKNYPLNGYFTRLAITQLQFQWNLPTIITGYNDQLLVTITTGVDAGVKTLTLTEGYYTPDDLATQIETQLQAAAGSSGFTCTFGNGRFIITSTENFFIGDAGTTPNRFTRCYQTCGFFVIGGSASTGYVSNTPSMLPTHFIDINSSYITKFQDVKDSSTSQSLIFNCQIARVYPTPPNSRIDITGTSSPGSNPFSLCIDYNTPKFILWNTSEALANFDIQLRDEYGALIPYDTTNGTYGCEYQMTMLASET